MIITCKECNTSFNLDETFLKPTGSKVRCSVCKEIFVAYPSTPAQEPKPESDIIPDYEIEEEKLEATEKGPTEKAGFDVSDSEDLFDEDEDDAEKPEVVIDAKKSQEQEIDFFDIEDILDDEGSGEAGDENGVEETAELDLPDIEEMLDVDDSSAEEEPEDIELELDAELDGGEDEDTDLNTADEETEALDLSDLEKMIEIDDDSEETEEEDIELEFELDTESEDVIEEDSLGLEFDSDNMAVEELSDDDYDVQITDKTEEDIEQKILVDEGDKFIEDTEAGDKEDRKTKPAERKVGKLLIVLLILVIVAGGAFAAYTLLDSRGIKVPYISDLFIKEKESQDIVGNLKITPLEDTIKGSFVENSEAGTLYVITGKIRNDYDHPRSFARVTANLFTKGGVRTKSKTVYCGNVLSTLDLENLDLDAINKRLNNREGDNKSNVNIKQGDTLQFMIVFSKLLEDMGMFNVQVAGSSP